MNLKHLYTHSVSWSLFLSGWLLVAANTSAQVMNDSTSSQYTQAAPGASMQTLLGHHGHVNGSIWVSGRVSAHLMKFPAHVQVTDAAGHQYLTLTNPQGYYKLQISDLQFPLVASAYELDANCSRSDTLRGICMGSFWTLEQQPHHMGNRIRLNINPLTDKMLSYVATASGYIGPQQVIDQPDAVSKLSANAMVKSQQVISEGFGQAFTQLGLPANFNPVTYTAKWQPLFKQLVSVLLVNRNYQTSNGQVSSTTLTDTLYHPLPATTVDGAVQPFDINQFRMQLQAVQRAKTRIFILGDSTASIYPGEAYPRTGWGQVFAEQFQNVPEIKVVDAAESGRSSRSFYNQGWFRFMRAMMRPGDYLLIQMGHNDEKCKDDPDGRGQYDVRNTCTYPNDAEGHPQFPMHRPQMSFQYSLSWFIRYAKAHHMTPVLLTPTTRIKNAEGKTGFPVVHTHLTQQDSGHNYAYVGDYSQTVRDTGRINQVPVLELEQATIQLANQLGEDHWKEYWLAVDPQQYPYYKDRTGRLDKPDTTHFQHRGAEAVAAIVAQLIAEQPELKPIAHYLKR
ncbi:GDSL-type esterase/lipase family protein [Celerinatantimonas sp. YJH-8]|uniref:GDSL-type esterase/lipase family protein n=1 Tax=Celerinatantimonas sp. YJH-8 TaxID=3228714 RepID=UPI0038C90A83